jgi:hypothetical protein
MEKKKCNHCKREFSAHLINAMVVYHNGKHTSTPMCPICALENDGTGRTEFTGTMAEALRQEALKEVKLMNTKK